MSAFRSCDSWRHLAGRARMASSSQATLGQRIFQQPFSWKALGVDVRGRSSTLRINYRTSHQIRTQADRLLGPEVSDVDGNKEERKGTVSTFNGPQPDIMVLDTPKEEIKAVSQWLAEGSNEGIVPHEIGVFVRSAAELDRARAAVEDAKLPYKVLDDNVETTSWPGFDQHHASCQGSGVPNRCGDGL